MLTYWANLIFFFSYITVLKELLICVSIEQQSSVQISYSLELILQDLSILQWRNYWLPANKHAGDFNYAE